MLIRNSRERWGSLSQFLHWLIVALIAAQAALGLTGLLLPLGMEKLVVLARHKSIGITILGLAALRLLWRWLNPTPSLPSNLRRYERFLAHCTHAALYVLLFAMPLTGWMMSSARGFPVSWFNLFQLPDLVPKSQPLYRAMVTTHAALAISLAAVVALHIAGALKHHFVLKDDTLRRMLPFGRSTLGAAALALLAAPAARAAAPVYTLQAAKSSLTYAFVQAGGVNQGRFKSFSVSFDPTAGRLDVVIDMRSSDTGDQQRNGLLGSYDFFDVAQYPQARFTASRIERTATGFDATGSLTLRGVSRSISVPFTWHTATGNGRPIGYLSGRTILRRLDFGVGQGQWHYTQWVGNDVTVRFALVLTAGK
ncbi:MAG TPA: YceI family protein [Steroidobacteraceae bacterium]|nr:YceI family protein [Steroidobacteraceae bacterium]